MKTDENTHGRLLFLTDLGTVRVLTFRTAGDDPKERAHLAEISEKDLGLPRGAATTDEPGKFNRGFASGQGEAMSHAETKLDVEVEKRAIAQVAREICRVVDDLGCSGFVLAAPRKHLKRLESEMTADCLTKLRESHGLDLTNSSLKDLEKRFL